MKRVLITASVVSFIEWFNKENVEFLRQELGCEVHIACNFDYMRDTDEDRTKKYLDKLRGEGVLLHNIPFDRSPLTASNFKAYRQLKKLIDEGGFDLIHCHTPAAAMITRLAARRARRHGSVVMYTCHGFHFHNASSKKNWIVYYPVERIMSRFCDYIVTINHEDFERAKTFHAKNVRYIPGVGVDTERIARAKVDKRGYKRSIGVPEDCVMLLSVGELIERKNHRVIIEALSKLKRSDIYYVICGKGPLKEELAALAEKYGIAERVVFLGFRNDIPELNNTADISAFPSKIEGLGLAGIEAMAAGVPVVASNVHGILDYVRDGETGFAVPPDDAEGFARAIEKLADDPELREKMGKRCTEAAKPFELSRALETMWAIYREILCLRSR